MWVKDRVSYIQIIEEASFGLERMSRRKSKKTSSASEQQDSSPMLPLPVNISDTQYSSMKSEQVNSQEYHPSFVL